MGVRLFGLALLTLSFCACTQGHCRRKAATPETPVDVLASESVPPNGNAKPGASERVHVYKYDGSLQCGMGKGVAVDAMAKELNGIQIFTSTKKADGLMHIQVCGSITGMANVYEIPAKSLKAAEGKGFKKWSFE